MARARYTDFVILGLDFGLTNLDAMLLEGQDEARGWSMSSPGASVRAVQNALDAGEVDLGDLTVIGTTGGRHKELPERIADIPLVKVGEADAIGRGGLHMANLSEALVISAGTGTAMIAARGATCAHVTGSAVGGGTLLSLGLLCLGTRDPLEIAALAARGNPSHVDGTLEDVLGGGIGHLPADATAVNLGRITKLKEPPSREDLAAGLVTLVAQVIAMITLNALKANNLERAVFVGHLMDLEPMQAAIKRVWGFYSVPKPPIIPESRGFATALGAAICASETA
jgi:type II pantothenate kinase